MTQIILNIYGQNINIEEINVEDLIVSNSIGLYSCKFNFDESWNDYIKTAVFITKIMPKGIEVKIDKETNSCKVPSQILIANTKFYVGVYGRKQDKRKPTIFSSGILVRRGAAPTLEAIDPPIIIKKYNDRNNLDFIKLEEKICISFSVINQEIFIDNVDPSEIFLVSGSVKEYLCKFNFDKSWDEYKKIAVFITEENPKGVELSILDNNICEIPAQVLIARTKIRVGVYGVKKGCQRPTIFSPGLIVQRGAVPTTEASQFTPSSFYTDVLKIMRDTEEIVKNIEENAKNGKYSGVFSSQTKNDFPPSGSENIVYKATLEKKIYQWNSIKQQYEIIGGEPKIDITTINGGAANG